MDMALFVELLVEPVIGLIIALIVIIVLEQVVSEKEAPVGKFPWFFWLFAHLVGGAGGGLVSAAIKGVVQGGMANWAAFGASLGVMQWLVLRHYIPVGRYWAVATTIGWSTFTVFQLLVFPTPLAWFCTGIMVGLMQWLVIKKKATYAGWWFGINCIAWSIAGFLGFYLGLAILDSTQNPILSWVAGWAIIAGIGAMILALPMMRMQPLHPSAESEK
jgi:hypothetical protein